MKHVDHVTFHKGDIINNQDGTFEITFGAEEFDGIQHYDDDREDEKTHYSKADIKHMLREYNDTDVRYYIEFEFED